MYGSIVWKLLLTCAIVAWAVANLVPTTETPFPEYLQEAAGAHLEEFRTLYERAEQKAEEEEVTLFMAMRDIANEERIDLAKFFPQIRLEESLRNIERRNSLVLNEMLNRSHAALQLGLDLRGGASFTLEFDERPDEDISHYERQELLQKAIEIMRSRLDGLGVAEPVIRPVGDNRIEIQLPGVSTRDNPEIIDTIRAPARLELRLVHRTLRGEIPEDEIPPGYELLRMEVEDPDTGEIVQVPYVVHRIPRLTGEMINRAFVSTDDFGRFRVVMNFTSEGGDLFADITREIARENERTGTLGQMAIVLDGVLYSAPSVRREITGGSAEITGRFSQREAIELANVLNNPLDVPLRIVQMYEVGPTMAEDAVDAAKTAMMIGASLVIAFMVVYYIFAGIVAAFTLAVNVLIILGVLASLGATLTLPGIAGIILTIGMAVDANILIFERIREELKMGKPLRTALVGGYEKALSAIVDANVTTLLTALVLFWLGTGPVKGFGITLAIGIGTSVFGALIVTRFLLEALVNAGKIQSLRMNNVFKEFNFDFLKYRRLAFVTSWIIVAIGVVTVFVKGDRIYGIDFVGGDELHISFTERLATSDIEAVAAAHELGEVIPVYRSPIGSDAEQLVVQTETDRGNAFFDALVETYPDAGLHVEGENRIGPAVGREIRINAMLSIGIALIGILLYVAVRFEMGYGVGAVVAVVHDLLMTVGIFVLADRQFTAPMVAGVLMVAGYSINDSIVVFDRIREQLQLDPNGKLRNIINDSINKVMPRTLLTSFTTLLATGALWVFGTGVVNDFAFIFIIGILTGTFSSIFIASPVFFWWHKGDRRHVEERKDVLPNYEWMASTKASK